MKRRAELKPARCPHVVYDVPLAEFRCLRCRMHYRPALPCPVNVFVAAASAFIKDHAGCARRQVA